MRQELEREIINMLAETGIVVDTIKEQLTIILSEYEISKRETELVVYNESKNEMLMKKFISAKLASGRTERTIKQYRTECWKVLNSIGKAADEITPDDIRLYMALRVRRDGVSKVTAQNELRCISSFFTFLRKEELIIRNPMDKVDSVKVKSPKKKAFTDLEIEKIRNECQTTRETAIIEILLSTWCRVSELCTMKLSDIDGEKVLVHGKGEKDRDVYLNAKAQIALDKYMADRKDNNPYLFPKAKYAGELNMMVKGRKRSELSQWYKDPSMVDELDHTEKSTIESIVRSLGKRAGVEKAHPHRFRRTGATFALRHGMPLVTVSKLLGHENISTTQIYLDISDDELANEHKRYVT